MTFRKTALGEVYMEYAQIGFGVEGTTRHVPSVPEPMTS